MMMMVFIVYYVIDCIVYVLLERKMVLGSEIKLIIKLNKIVLLRYGF